MTNSDVYYHKQLVDNCVEVIELKKCFVQLGTRCPPPPPSEASDQSYGETSSDEEFKYFGRRSDTESYDSDDNGFHRIVEAVNRLNATLAAGHDMKPSGRAKAKATTTGPKTRRTSKRGSKGKASVEPKVVPKPEAVADSPSPPEPQPPEPVANAVADEEMAEELVMPSMADQSLLEDDFYAKNMEYFMSQSLSQVSQASALSAQTGGFSYYQPFGDGDRLTPKNRSLRVKQSMDDILKPVIDLLDEETNDWSLILKVLPEYQFAFRNPSKSAVRLSHGVLAHYNWSDDRQEMSDKYHFEHFQDVHRLFVATFMKEILLSCYSRPEIVRVIGGGLGAEAPTNAWTFISKLITFLINESIKKSEEFAFALLHFKLIVSALINDFRLFVTESTDLFQDIQRVDTREECPKPVIVRIVWPQRNPNYINSVLKQIIYFTIKVIKIKDESLLDQMLALFELCAECLRIGSGNVRPFVKFVFNKQTPITELFQQLNSQSLFTNEVIETLINRLAINWIKLQFCAHFMTKFIIDLKNKYITEKKRQISLKLIVECLTNAKILSTHTTSHRKSLSSSQSTAGPSGKPSKASVVEPMKRRSSVGLATNRRESNHKKQWTKRLNKFGESGLHTAATKGELDKLKELLAMSADGFGYDPNETCFGGYTPLCDAAVHGKSDCIRALIEWQAVANKRLDFTLGPNRQTALHDCVENNDMECALLILEAGGLELLDIHRTTDDKTPTDVIRSEEMRQLIDGLRQTMGSSKASGAKINVRTADDSRVFIRVVTQVILQYIQTTRIDLFATYSQDQWPIEFYELFDREMTDTDMSALIEDLAVFRKLPTFMTDLKALFTTTSTELIDDLELALSFITFSSD